MLMGTDYCDWCVGLHETVPTIIWYSDLVSGGRADGKMFAIKKIAQIVLVVA